MIVVTGASGQLGRAIALQLADRVPSGPGHLAVSVRDPGKVADLALRGIRVVQADFADPPSLRPAFEGATQLMLVSSNVGAQGGDPLAQHRAAIAAAQEAGVRRIVYTSHMAASPDSAFPPMRDHAATEAMLAASGLAWTALRNGFYGASAIPMMGDAPVTGVLAAPADGPVAWTAHADLAEAAARILTGTSPIDGPTPPLTGPQALDFAALAAIASGLLPHPVRREVISDAALLARIAARGLPDRAGATILGFFIASRNGEFGPVDGALEKLLDRPLTTMQTLLQNHFAA